MSREIKFRAWDGAHMVPAEFIRVSGSLSSVFAGPAAFMQYTGLHDKNGVEIYEEDILWWSEWQQEEVDVPDAYIVSWLPERAMFVTNCYRDGRHLDPKNDPMHKEDTFEVVGNIYSNPELLS